MRVSSAAKGVHMKTMTTILTLLVMTTISQAQTAAPSISNTCIACHGQSGISNNQIWPNLAGQKEGYLVKQLKAFKAGDRKDPMMSAMVQNLSDADIELLAKYFSSITTNCN